MRHTNGTWKCPRLARSQEPLPRKRQDDQDKLNPDPMTVPEDGMLKVVEIGLKEEDAAATARAEALHLEIPILTGPTAEELVQATAPETVQVQTDGRAVLLDSLESLGKSVPMTANRKQQVATAVQTIDAVMTAEHEEEARNVEDGDQLDLTTDKVTAETMIVQHVLEIAAKIPAEAQEVLTDRNVKKDAQSNALVDHTTLEIKAVRIQPSPKKPFSNLASLARPGARLEGSLDLVRTNDANFGLRIAPL
jgi:hypothetical protein